MCANKVEAKTKVVWNKRMVWINRQFWQEKGKTIYRTHICVKIVYPVFRPEMNCFGK